MKQMIIDGNIWHPEREHRPGYHDLRGLITGHFFECLSRYCREDDEESQRALWDIFRDDILAAQAKYAPKQKPWAIRFDRKRREADAG
jgi:hypothetical protein